MSNHGQAERHYPCLETCQLTLRNIDSSNQPPVRLPPDIVQYAATPGRSLLPDKPYDFALGKEREYLLARTCRVALSVSLRPMALPFLHLFNCVWHFEQKSLS
jgi:hypothetical protein